MHMYHTHIERIEGNINFKIYQDTVSEQALFVIGESNVYTLGNIGAHRIVCTKLPTVGHTREAMTAAGNTTTRLLGTHHAFSSEPPALFRF